MENRYSIKVAGESGMGLLSVGEIIMKALKRMGYFINSDREYPSLIKGGNSNSQIEFSTQPVRSLSAKADILIALGRNSLEYYLSTIKPGGILLHGYERHHLIKDLQQKAQEHNITVIYLPATKIALEMGGNQIVTNMVLIGFLWRLLKFDYQALEDQVKHQFADKPKILPIDLKCIDAGFKSEGYQIISSDSEAKSLPDYPIASPQSMPDKLLIDGSAALGLGAIHAGVRTYYAYPMSPSSGILSYLAQTSHQTGIVVKQAEDEITAAQMAIGSMYAGTRALVATSGGGFDLMTESVSLAGIIENPLVIIIAQRPGPGTGLPTWTAQGDLNLAIHSGHGEFARMVIGCSDPQSSFELIQHALNFAEKFQVPVIVLTEKTIVETKVTTNPFQQKQIPIERGLVTDPQELAELKPSDRYQITESGLSKRWVPGSSETTFFANGDEHNESGQLTEEAGPAGDMYAKRVKKQQLLIDELPEPTIHGAETEADISFVGWGSSKNVMLDAIDYYQEQGIKVNYLHYDYLWPLKTEKFTEFAANNQNLILIEGNYNGQFGTMLEDKTKVQFTEKLLKWDGRPFYFDEIIGFIQQNTSNKN